MVQLCDKCQKKVACQQQKQSYCTCVWWCCCLHTIGALAAVSYLLVTIDWIGWGLNGLLNANMAYPNGFDLLKWNLLFRLNCLIDYVMNWWSCGAYIYIFYNIINGHWCQVLIFFFTFRMFYAFILRAPVIVRRYYYIPSENRKKTHTQTHSDRFLWTIVLRVQSHTMHSL